MLETPVDDYIGDYTTQIVGDWNNAIIGNPDQAVYWNATGILNTAHMDFEQRKTSLIIGVSPSKHLGAQNHGSVSAKSGVLDLKHLLDKELGLLHTFAI